jgi:hypothetical protein
VLRQLPKQVSDKVLVGLETPDDAGVSLIDEERALTYVGVFGPEPNFSGVNPSTGPLPANGVGFTNRYLQTLVFTRKFSEDVLGVIQSDFGTQHDAVVAGQTAKWYGINTYLYWNQTCRCQWGANFEWFRDQGGCRSGEDQTLVGFTGTVEWRPVESVAFQVEYRHDLSSKEVFGAGDEQRTLSAQISIQF